MNKKSFIATVLFAIFAFPQIFGCAGTDFGRAFEENMGADGFRVITPLGVRTKNVYLARMALSKDSAVILPKLVYMRLAPNPRAVSVVFEHSYQGIDYTVVRSNLLDNTTVSSLVIIPQQGIDTQSYTLLKDSGNNDYSMYPAGKEYVVLVQPLKDDPQNAYVWVLKGTTPCGEATMPVKDTTQGLVFDPNTKTIWTLKELADKSKKSKPKTAKVEEGGMPAAQSVPLTSKEGQSSPASGGSTPSGRSSAPAPQAAPEPVPNGPKVLQDSKPDTQSIL